MGHWRREGERMRTGTGKAKRVTEINTVMIQGLARESEEEKGVEMARGEREMERKGARERNQLGCQE